MSTRPGIRSLARGAVFALAAAMAFATFGCQQAIDSDSDEEQVDEIALPIAPGAPHADDQTDGTDSIPSCGEEQMDGNEEGEPEPQPWINGNTGSSKKPGPGPVDPSTRSSVVLPTGHH